MKLKPKTKQNEQIQIRKMDQHENKGHGGQKKQNETIKKTSWKGAIILASTRQKTGRNIIIEHEGLGSIIITI